MGVLEDEFGVLEKVKIACNVKIVYREERQTHVYAVVFLVLYHVVLLPTCLLTEFAPVASDNFYIPIIC